MKRVDPKDISIVFQGPLVSRGSNVLNGILSARKVFPGAEIILSTWQGPQQDELAKYRKVCDKVVQSPIAESVYFDPYSGAEDNAHRQVISTMAGLRVASRPYCFKVRSDISFINANLAISISSGETFNFWSEKIVTLTSGTVDPAKFPMLFHLTDLIMFGKTADLVEYWDSERPSADVACSVWEWMTAKIWFGRTGFRFSRLSVEQRLLLDFLRRRGHKINLPYLDSINRELAFISESVIANNFLIFPTDEAGVVLNPHLRRFDKYSYNRDTLDALSELSCDSKKYFSRRYRSLFLRKYLHAFGSPYFYKGLAAILLMSFKICRSYFQLHKHKLKQAEHGIEAV